MSYAQRYAGGFVNGDGSRQVDATFLNNVEDALLKLFGVVPVTNGALVWDGAKFTAAAKIVNAQIDAAAAIDKTKLGPLAIVDADVAGGAAIAGSKLANVPPSKLTGYPSDGTKKLLGDGTWANSGWSVIDEQILPGVGTITFASIPQTYRALKVLGSVRGGGAAVTDTCLIQFNGDTVATNYQGELISGSTATVTSSGGTAASISAGSVVADSSTASMFSALEFEIPYYARTDRYKNVVGRSHGFASGPLYLTSAFSGAWLNAGSGITSIKILCNATANLKTGSRAMLLGLA